MKGSSEIRTRQTAPQIELLAIAYVLLFSCFFSFTIFLFLLNLFFSYTFDIYFFPARSTQELTTKKIELNWIKDVAYTKSGLCSEKYAKTCGLENSIFLTEFRNSNFYEPSKPRMKRI